MTFHSNAAQHGLAVDWRSAPANVPLSQSFLLFGRVALAKYAPTTEAYRWPDRSCHPGQFAFVVGSKTRAAYLDRTGAKEVSIDMRDIMFQPAAIVVSKGTTVTWTNRDAVTHFVNTDPHPSHNVLGELNSLDLAQGQSFGLTFNQPGEWGYHCSAHFPQGMVGRVIVQP